MLWNRARQRSRTNHRLESVFDQSFAHDSHSLLAVWCSKVGFVDVLLAPTRRTEQVHKAGSQSWVSLESAYSHFDADVACFARTPTMIRAHSEFHFADLDYRFRVCVLGNVFNDWLGMHAKAGLEVRQRLEQKMAHRDVTGGRTGLHS